MIKKNIYNVTVMRVTSYNFEITASTPEEAQELAEQYVVDKDRGRLNYNVNYMGKTWKLTNTDVSLHPVYDKY